MPPLVFQLFIEPKLTPNFSPLLPFVRQAASYEVFRVVGRDMAVFLADGDFDWTSTQTSVALQARFLSLVFFPVAV